MAMLSGCSTAIAPTLDVGDTAFSVCYPDTNAEPMTVGITVARSDIDTTITDVQLVDATNVHIIDWYVADPHDFIGLGEGFSPSGSHESRTLLPAGEERAIHIGIVVREPALAAGTSGASIEVTSNGLTTSRTVPITLELLPAGDEC
jgi:hypothetical protein